MTGRLAAMAAAAASALALLAGTTPAGAATGPGSDWPVYGGGSAEQHYSPLAQINAATVQRLQPAWSAVLDVPRSNAEPIAIDGVVYVAAALSVVQAFDARSGRRLWRYDPQVGVAAGTKLRYSWGVRGLAHEDGRLFVGTQDGRLLALDARRGTLLWSVQTTEGAGDGRYITGAPRVMRGRVVIGHGGADFSPVRGYVTAYDTKTGQQLWRFHTVPGDPAKGFESEAQAMAARTWSGQWWQHGGGGTVWNAMTYDAELDRVYLGTGNGAPWNWKVRNPEGGDALFLASIVALDAGTGRYLWHYQQNPNEAWDYNATADIALATVTLDGQPRKVLMQAPKNGFYYVVDRETGRLLSAEKLGKVTWAERIDLATGRPVSPEGVRYEGGTPVTIWPGNLGLHNWPPMAFSPRTGLAYIPTIESPGLFGDAGIDTRSWRHAPGGLNSALGPQYSAEVPNTGKAALLAWDPLRQQAAWRLDTPTPWNGGVLATAGNLVFQGHIDGTLNAFDARDGRKLWSHFTGNAVLGAPISYRVGGRQYLSVITGPPAGAMMQLQGANAWGWRYRDHPVRLVTYALDGRHRLPTLPPPGPEQPLHDPGFTVDATRAAQGAIVYFNCIACHGPDAVSLGSAPDLRASPLALSAEAWRAVVRDGTLVARGMPGFPELDDEQLLALRHYLRSLPATPPR